MNNSVVTHIFGYLLGLLIFVIGIPALMWLVTGRPLLNFLVEVIFLTLQVHSEEKRLEKDFGKDYLDYKKRVGRYFPLIICKNGSR